MLNKKNFSFLVLNFLNNFDHKKRPTQSKEIGFNKKIN
jgi:hypothetical protein